MLITSNLDSHFSELKKNQLNLSNESQYEPKIATKGLLKNASPVVTTQSASYYHPLYEPVNLQLPTKLREINQWARYFRRTDPLVHNALSLHSEFPVTGFRNLCDDSSIQKFYDKLSFDVLKLPQLLSFISSEFEGLGNCFPMGMWDDSKGHWSRFITLNPDYVEIEKNIFADKPILRLDPDDSLRKIVQNRAPRDIYEKLDPKVIEYVAKGMKVPLSNFFIQVSGSDKVIDEIEIPQVTHLSNATSMYEAYGLPYYFCVFKVLIYKDILRRAQHSIAKRHWKPVKVVKVGDDTHHANNETLSSVKEAMDQASADPDSWFIWHNYVSFDYVASAGHVMPLNSEYDWVNKELYAGLGVNEAILTGGGVSFCLSEDTETLTEDGFKTWDQIDEKDKIATFNPKTQNIEYNKYNDKHVSNYNGEMINFKNGKIDVLVTPDHNMWYKKRLGYGNRKYADEFVLEKAKNIKDRPKFQSVIDWKGKEPKEKYMLGDKEVLAEDYLRFIGYYLSEGYTVINKKTRNYQVGITQDIKSKYRNNMESLLSKLPYIFKNYGDYDMRTCNIKLAYFCAENFGKGSFNKYIPKELKMLDKKWLKILLDCLMEGDGYTRPATIKKKTNKKYYIYTTVSKKLSDDVYEIAWKVGYVPIVFKNKNDNRYVICFSDGEAGKYPTLNKTSEIKRINYNGIVYCFDVPNHLFVIRRNGLINIQGNSNASVALKIMINKYMRKQKKLATWVRENIYKPVAQVQQFYKINKDGEQELIYPEIEWEMMRLQDDAQQKALYERLQKAGIISKRTFVTYLGLDYEKEKNLVKQEQQEDLKDVKDIEKKKKEITQKQPAKEPLPPPPIGAGELPPPPIGEEGLAPPSPGEKLPMGGGTPGETKPPESMEELTVNI